jgi:hypothetical protein
VDPPPERLACGVEPVERDPVDRMPKMILAQKKIA